PVKGYSARRAGVASADPSSMRDISRAMARTLPLRTCSTRFTGRAPLRLFHRILDVQSHPLPQRPPRCKGEKGGKEPQDKRLHELAAEDFSSDDEALDLGRPLPDFAEFHVPEVALDREVGEVPVAAVDLDGG